MQPNTFTTRELPAQPHYQSWHFKFMSKLRKYSTYFNLICQTRILISWQLRMHKGVQRKYAG